MTLQSEVERLRAAPRLILLVGLAFATAFGVGIAAKAIFDSRSAGAIAWVFVLSLFALSAWLRTPHPQTQPRGLAQEQVPVAYRIYGRSRFVLVLLLLLAGGVLIGTGSPGLGVGLLILVMVDMALIFPLLTARLQERQRIDRGSDAS